MLRLAAVLALAVLSLAACQPAGNNLTPGARSVMDGNGGPPTHAVVASPAPTAAPMDGNGGPPTI